MFVIRAKRGLSYLLTRTSSGRLNDVWLGYKTCEGQRSAALFPTLSTSNVHILLISKGVFEWKTLHGCVLLVGGQNGRTFVDTARITCNGFGRHGEIMSSCWWGHHLRKQHSGFITLLVRPTATGANYLSHQLPQAFFIILYIIYIYFFSSSISVVCRSVGQIYCSHTVFTARLSVVTFALWMELYWRDYSSQPVMEENLCREPWHKALSHTQTAAHTAHFTSFTVNRVSVNASASF